MAYQGPGLRPDRGEPLGQLNRLSEDCSRVLAAAAAIGVEFSAAGLSVIAELDAERLTELLDEAVGGGAISKLPGDAERYIFTGTRIRQVFLERDVVTMVPTSSVLEHEQTAQQELFIREGDYWTLRYEGILSRARDTKGLGYIARLLASPGTAVRSADLAMTEGRSADASLARMSVTKAIRGAIQKIAGQNPALGQHLSAAIKTGMFCSYTAVPGGPISWKL